MSAGDGWDTHPIPADAGGRCVFCDLTIRAGQDVQYNEDGGMAHPECLEHSREAALDREHDTLTDEYK